MILATTLGVGAVTLTAVFAFSKPKAVYSRHVSELLNEPLRDTPVRVEGILVGGSLCKVDAKCEFRFRLTDRASSEQPGARKELEVRFGQCVIPDTFRDAPGFDLSVTIQGELCDGCSHFEATHIMAKCPSKYEIPPGGYPPVLPVRSCGASRAR